MSGPTTDPSDDAPTGLPNEEAEAPPMGVDEPPPEDDETGPEAMPGIPTEGEPPTAG